MNAECFIDTNIVLYAVSSAPAEAVKARRVRQILAEEDFGISTQVLQEFFVNATRKIAIPLSDQQALAFIEILAEAPIIAIDLDLVIQAIAFRRQFAIAYWDAAIIAAAHQLKAKVLYTEDLNHGQLYGDVRALNPFR